MTREARWSDIPELEARARPWKPLVTRGYVASIDGHPVGGVVINLETFEFLTWFSKALDAPTRAAVLEGLALWRIETVRKEKPSK